MKNLLKCQEIMTIQHYTTGNLLNFSYHQNYHKLIGIDLLTQANTNIAQQFNFTENLAKDDGATMFFIAGKQGEKILSFCLD